MLHDGIHKYTVKMYPENDMPLLGYQDTLVSGEEYIRIGAVQIEIVYSPKDNISNKTSLGRITSYNDDDEVYEAIGKLPYYEFSGEFEAFNLPAECDGWYKSIDLKEYCENDSDKIPQCVQYVPHKKRSMFQLSAFKIQLCMSCAPCCACDRLLRSDPTAF